MTTRRGGGASGRRKRGSGYGGKGAWGAGKGDVASGADEEEEEEENGGDEDDQEEEDVDDDGGDGEGGRRVRESPSPSPPPSASADVRRGSRPESVGLSSVEAVPLRKTRKGPAFRSPTAAKSTHPPNTSTSTTAATTADGIYFTFRSDPHFSVHVHSTPSPLPPPSEASSIARPPSRQAPVVTNAEDYDTDAWRSREDDGQQQHLTAEEFRKVLSELGVEIRNATTSTTRTTTAAAATTASGVGTTAAAAIAGRSGMR